MMKFIVSTVILIFCAIAYHFYDFLGLVIVAMIGGYIQVYMEKKSED